MHQKFALGFCASTLLVCALVLTLLPKSKPQKNTGANTETTRDWYISNADVFDGERWHDDSGIVIRDGKVYAISTDVDEELPVLDAKGQAVIPGLIDAHTHSWGNARKDAQRFGVTTMLDMFTAPSQLPQAREHRTADTATDAASLYSAGMLATVDGGHGTQFGVPIETLARPEQAQAWVQRRLAEGSDYIKLVYIPGSSRINSLDIETARAVIDAAHDAGVLAVAHIDSQAAARELLDAGIDGFVHIFADSPVTDEFLTIASKNDVFFVPTLAVIASVNGDAPGRELLKDTRIEPMLSPAARAGLESGFGLDIQGFDLDTALSNVARLDAAGVTILAGSDAPNPGTAHGASLHQELSLLVRAGLSPTAALRAATILPADRFSLPGHGTLKPGAPADLLILGGDPRDDITATRDIRTMLRRGDRFERQRMAAKPADLRMPALAGDFESGIDAPGGFFWSETSDIMMGGNSLATFRRSTPGAGGSMGALTVEAESKDGFPYPWAGAFFGSEDQSGGASMLGYKTVTFYAKGSPGRYRMMFFGGGQVGAPPTIEFDMPAQWQQVRLSLDSLDGFDKGQVSGFALVTPATVGDFVFSIDDIRFVGDQ